jgi:hypothetical protein
VNRRRFLAAAGAALAALWAPFTRPVEYVPASPDERELEFERIRRETREEVAAVFGVPVTLMSPNMITIARELSDAEVATLRKSIEALHRG